MADFAYNQVAYFTSSTPIDGGPTAWGIYKVAAGALHSAEHNGEKIDELKHLVQDLGKVISQLNTELGVVKSELASLKRGVLTVRIRQEKSLLTQGTRILEVATIVAERVAPVELAQAGVVRPSFKIPIKNDPFAGAPELD
jgi:hypothetical protein